MVYMKKIYSYVYSDVFYPRGPGLSWSLLVPWTLQTLDVEMGSSRIQGLGKVKAKAKAKIPIIAPLLGGAENASLISSGTPSWNLNNIFHTNRVQFGIK